jgi:hypothetical protein
MLPLLNQVGDHFEESSDVPLNSSSKTIAHVPGIPVGKDAVPVPVVCEGAVETPVPLVIDGAGLVAVDGAAEALIDGADETLGTAVEGEIGAIDGAGVPVEGMPAQFEISCNNNWRSSNKNWKN